ncbi:hypothetical protein DLREEDagr8_14970 [Dongia sp. agr-C8]
MLIVAASLRIEPAKIPRIANRPNSVAPPRRRIAWPKRRRAADRPAQPLADIVIPPLDPTLGSSPYMKPGGANKASAPNQDGPAGAALRARLQ